MNAKSMIFLWKYNFLKPGSLAKYNDLKKIESFSHEELLQFSLEKFKRLVNIAFHYSSFYHEYYKHHGFHPKDLCTWDDVRTIPPLLKAHLRERPDDILIRGSKLSSLNKVSTGGSTGHPLAVYHPKSVNRAGALWRMKDWWGFEPAENFGTVYRNVSSGLRAIKDKAVEWPLRMVRLDATNIVEEEILRFVDVWNRIRPRLLHGYVGGLMALAEYLNKQQVAFHSPDVIWSTSAPISSLQKDFLKKVIGGDVYDQYGCCEVFYLAAEGPEKQGLRIFNDLRHIEIVDENNQPLDCEQEGRILITDYENNAFPLIRYENGDLGSRRKRPPDCKHPYGLLHPVKGRISEILHTPNGGKITGEFITTIFDDYAESIHQFKVHQHIDMSIDILVVPRDGAEIDSILSSTIERILRQTDSTLQIEAKAVDHIGHDKGKLRFITSDLSDHSNNI